MQTLKATLLALTGLAIAAPVLADAPVRSVGYASLSGPVVSFEDLTLADPGGSLLEGIVNSGGVQFGERFAGQELAIAKAPRPGSALPAQDWFDDLRYGSPVAGLVLLAGDAGANLGGYDYGDANHQALAGVGPQNSDGSDPFGMGAISARFSTPVSALGLLLRETDGGDAWLSLYRSDGSLIQTLSLGPLQDGTVAFERSDGSADIAGFTLYHRDSYYGIAIDNLVLASAVPEPAGAWLWAAGLIGLAALRSPRRTASVAGTTCR